MTGRPDLRVLSNEERQQMRQWLHTWQRAGQWLERQRAEDLAGLTDEQAWNDSLSLFAEWEPGMTGDDGEGLRLLRQVFAHASAHAETG
ncbi:MAG: hypothetical protein ABI211_01005 [Vicinamibacterales bacterium]